MNRAWLLAAVGLAVTGCVDGGPLGEIDVYWQFTRDVVGGSPVTYSCSQGGVDFVTVTDELGNPVGPSSLDSTLRDTRGNPVQGVAFTDFRRGHSYTFVVTGYRNNVTAPLFQGRQTIVFSGGVDQVTVTAAGEQGNLTALFTIAGTSFPTCGSADVQRFDYVLRDGSNTTVSQGSATCGAANAPGIDFGLIDLDNFLLSVDAVRTSTGPDVIVGSICRSPFDHFGTSSTVFDDTVRFDLPNTICQNP